MNINFRTVRPITLPLIKQQDDTPYFLKITGKIFQSDPVTSTKVRAQTSEKNQAEQAATESKNKKQPPELMHVIDLTDNQPKQIIVNTVLGVELRKAYPNDGYVGKMFQIERHKLQGKDYATYSIQEIEIVEDEKTEGAAAGASAGDGKSKPAATTHKK